MSDSVIDTITTLVLQKADAEQLLTAQTALHIRVKRFLAPGRAIEGTSDLTSSHEGMAKLDALGIEADIAVTSAADRKKSLLICDMDSTLIGQECIDELADFAGVKDRVSEITERAMRGEIGFNGALRERVGLLKGLPLSNLQRCFDERITVNPGAKTLVATIKADGAKTVIVSGGFTFFSERVAQACGFEAHQANILLDDGEALLGVVADPILGREAKLQTLLTQSDNTPETAIAIGDGANDLAMVTEAGLGIAYHAKPAVAAAAQCAIRYTDLRTALFYQGYAEDEFVECG